MFAKDFEIYDKNNYIFFAQDPMFNLSRRNSGQKSDKETRVGKVENELLNLRM